VLPASADTAADAVLSDELLGSQPLITKAAPKPDSIAFTSTLINEAVNMQQRSQRFVFLELQVCFWTFTL
jgi:hypothetical protein